MFAVEKRKGPLWRLAWLLTRRPRSVVLLAVTCLIMAIYRRLGGRAASMTFF